MTHAELVSRAGRWLANTVGCSVVLTEHTSYCGEAPDAIGWKSHASYLVECKVSVSDFYADRAKQFRRTPGAGVGDFRFYLTPPGLLDPAKIPEGWGLYEVQGKRVCYVGGVRYTNCAKPPLSGNLRAERTMLVSGLRRALDTRYPWRCLREYDTATAAAMRGELDQWEGKS